MQETPARFLGQEDPLRRDRLPTPVFSGFPRDSAGKGSACNMGDGFNPCVGRSPGGGKGYPLRCSGLENSMNCIVHEIAKTWTQLSDFYFHFQAKTYQHFLHLFSRILPSKMTFSLKNSPLALLTLTAINCTPHHILLKFLI